MEKEYRYMAVAYRLSTVANGQETPAEVVPKNKPFAFVTNMGIAQDEFEDKVKDLAPNTDFDFTLPVNEAFGEYHSDRVRVMDKKLFSVDGVFDEENVFVGAMIPLENQDGNRFMGRVVDVGNYSVTIDLNHPLAGKELHFVGTVLENRLLTDEEVELVRQQLNGGGCGHCKGHCGGRHHHEEGEGCCHEHEEGEGCCHGEGECHCGHNA